MINVFQNYEKTGLVVKIFLSPCACEHAEIIFHLMTDNDLNDVCGRVLSDANYHKISPKSDIDRTCHNNR